MPLITYDIMGNRRDKVQVAIDRLRAFEPEDGYYLAFSGGKDSQCIYHLAEMAGVKFDAHYRVTSVDPPELVSFIKRQYPDAGEWVLTYCGGYAKWFDLNKWCGNCWLKTMPVTHWMPLPEPPKEDA